MIRWYHPTCGRLLITLIPLLFVFTLVICVYNAPDHYKTVVTFPDYLISNLGNHQPSLGWFTFGLFSIALCVCGMVVLLKHNKFGKARRASEDCDNDIVLNNTVVYFVGAGIVVGGLVITGSFQQTFNEPLHLIGVGITFLGILILMVYDTIWAFKKDRQNKIKQVVHVLFWTVLIMGGLGFIVCYLLAERDWYEAKDDWFASRPNSDPCPKQSSEITIFPCKSRIFWDSSDPGWSYYRISAHLELTLFLLVVLYPLTYWDEISGQKDICQFWETIVYFNLQCCCKDSDSDVTPTRKDGRTYNLRTINDREMRMTI